MELSALRPRSHLLEEHGLTGELGPGVGELFARLGGQAGGVLLRERLPESIELVTCSC